MTSIIPPVLRDRLEELRAAVCHFRALKDGGAKLNESRLNKAEKLLNEASAALTPVESQQEFSVRNAFYNAALQCQVELDCLKHGEVDPTAGFLDFSPASRPGETLLIENQLSRLYLDLLGAGSIYSFEYLPRRINLSGSLPSLLDYPISASSDQALRQELFQTHEARERGSGPLKITVMKHTPGLLTLRTKRDFLNTPVGGVLYRDLTVKAGVGAHLQGATTGFSVEYWLDDGERSQVESSFIVCEFNLTLPSLNSVSDGAISVRALQSVGAVSTEVLNLSSPHFLSQSSQPGGLHGARLIDGLEEIGIDFRFSKPLSAVAVAPVFDSLGIPLAIKLQFVMAASRIYSDAKSNMLFLSIVS